MHCGRGCWFFASGGGGGGGGGGGFFFFKQKTAYEIGTGDWSSDVCSSDLGGRAAAHTISIREIGSDDKVWPIYRGLMRVGRLPDNDLVIAEPWVSSKHAEIFYRRAAADAAAEPTYFLRDFSRYGTYYLSTQGWQQIHRQEVPLSSGMQLRFGSSDGCLLEFVIEPTVNT